MVNSVCPGLCLRSQLTVLFEKLLSQLRLCGLVKVTEISTSLSPCAHFKSLHMCFVNTLMLHQMQATLS